MKICVVGSTNIDLTFRVERLPRPGETLSSRSLSIGQGGKGANQAVAAARLGASVRLISCVGSDPHGHDSLKNFEKAGIDTSAIQVEPDTATGTAAIFVDDLGENSIVIAAGANGRLTSAIIRSAAETIRSSHTLLSQLETPLDATLEAFRIARSSGVRTILTPAPACTLPAELLELCDIMIPNRSELELLAGCDLSQSSAGAEQAAGRLLNQGVGCVVLTLGSRGVMVFDNEGVAAIAARQVQAVDTTGAGDAFTAALAVFTAEGLSLRDAAYQACAVAALSVTRNGAQASFPTREEFEAFRIASPDASKG